MGDAQLKPRGIDVRDLEMSGLGKAQAAAKDGHEEHACKRVASGADGNELFDLFEAEHPGRLDTAGRSLDANEEGFDVLSQQSAVERAEGVDGEVDGGSGKLALGDEVKYPRTDLGRAQQVRGAVVKGGETPDPVGVSLHGAAGLLLEDEVVDETLTQRRLVEVTYGNDRLRGRMCGYGDRIDG